MIASTLRLVVENLSDSNHASLQNRILRFAKSPGRKVKPELATRHYAKGQLRLASQVFAKHLRCFDVAVSNPLVEKVSTLADDIGT